MSWTFTITGRESELSTDFYPPIELDDPRARAYVIGLIDFQTYNAIPNIDQANNKFYYGQQQQQFEIPEGQYELADLNKYIRKKLGVTFEGSAELYLANYKRGKLGPFFQLIPNLNTLTCSMICSEEVDFSRADSLGSMLGFEKRKYAPFKIHEALKTVDIFNVNVIQIECSVVTDSYKNDKKVHILHEFYPTVPPGYKIVQVPATIVYLPVNTRRISNITIRIVDQLGRLVNFRNEEITLRLHLKSLS